MPKVAYSEEDRERIRNELVSVGLALMAKQGIQHTTVEQIYKKVGISRTFFYSFFSTKEDLIVETLYMQQPKIIAYVQKLMSDPALSWRDAVKQFLYSCAYGEKNGIAILTIEEQQLIFKRLSKESYQENAAPSFWRNSGKSRDIPCSCKGQFIYKFKSDRNGDTQSHSKHTAPACSGGC